MPIVLQNIGIGNAPNDNLGDPIRTAFDKCNQNFNALNNVSPNQSVITQYVKAGPSMSIGQPVYITGANGTNVIVGLASNNSEATSSKTLGLLAQNLSSNGLGYVVTEGLLGGLNTGSGLAGDSVWLGLNGGLIYGNSNRPLAPLHMVFIGYVTRANANNGEIYVKPQNGFELNELHDVSIASPLANHSIVYDPNTSLWKNQLIQRTIINATPNTSVAFTPSLTQIGSFFIPANSFSPIDKINIQSMMFEKIGNGANAKYYVYLSPVNGIAGNVIAYYQPATDSKFVNLVRNFSQYNGNLYGWNILDSAPSGIGGSPNPISITPFNSAQSYYIVIAVDMTTTVETIIFRSCHITN